MGRLVRRFIRAYKITQGTDSSPITVSVASLIAHEIGHNVAIAGTAEGLKATMECYITSGVLNLIGVHAKLSTTSGKTQGGGYQYGIYVENEVLGTAIHAGHFTGLRMELYVESGATFSSASVYCIHIANSIAANPARYYFMRCSENEASTVTACFQLVKGALASISYLFELVGVPAAWNPNGTCSGVQGYLKVLVDNVDRYVQLYNAVA